MTLDPLEQIRILESDQILPFETWSDRSAAPTIELDDIRCIRHPFLVTTLEDSQYLLLADTDFFLSLAEAGLDHVPAQVCPPSQISLQPTRLGLVDFTGDSLDRLCARHPDQIKSAGESPSSDGWLNMRFDFADQASRDLLIRHSQRRGCPEGLRSLHREIGRLTRIVPGIDLEAGNQTGTFSYRFGSVASVPAFAFDDLVYAVNTESLFPHGIVDVSASFRLLDIDLPMNVLRAKTPVEEKELFLRDLLHLRQQSRRTSRYTGQVFVLNNQHP